MKHYSDWLVLDRDFTVQTITMETVHFCIFSLSWEIQVERNTDKKLLKKRINIFIATVQLDPP